MIYFGAAWYPEHWPEERWPEDIRLMREAGITVCRIAEFAWSTMEPTEGQYSFGWLERAVERLAEANIAVVIGTPTAAPPAWLTHHHPDTVAIGADGRPVQHGNRCHYSPTSPTYHKYARRIAEQMAKRFGPDERVMGWQIDNEYNRIDYSDASRRLFQTFLKERYATLESLNQAWSTAYWSQTYGDWNEIPIPIGPHNPGLMLDFRRFVSRVWRDFQKVQIESIHLYSRPEQWITHNFMGWFDGFDHYTVAQDLDMVSWDWYVGTGHHDYTRTGSTHDLTRGLKRKNFWLMETQPGSVNWSGNNNMLNRGEGRCMAWHAIAHGADAILYWQWRPAAGGQEQLHGSLLGADGNPRPFYQEAQQIGGELGKVADALDGTAPRNEVAILHSYDARWSIDAQKHNSEFNPVAHLQHWYASLIERNVGVDIISSEADLSGYRLVIAPSVVVLTDAAAESLIGFVQAGGTLVLTVRCGQKDAHNALFPSLQPGPLREIAGAEVAEYYALDEAAPLTAEWRGRAEGQSETWAELLRPLTPKTRVIARFGDFNGWLDGGPAATIHAVGNGGKVVTVGAVLDDRLQSQLTAWLLEEANVTRPLPDSPEGVELARRVGDDGKAVIIAINHTRLAKDFSAELSGEDLLTGETIRSEVTLEPYGVRVIRN